MIVGRVANIVVTAVRSRGSAELHTKLFGVVMNEIIGLLILNLIMIGIMMTVAMMMIH